MNVLDTARGLHDAFANRGLDRVQGSRETLRPGGSSGDTLIIRDLALSRSILRSRDFESIDEFREGYARLAARGRPLRRIEAFFAHSPLFKDGPAARRARHDLMDLLGTHGAALAGDEPRIAALMLARRARLPSPLAFSRLFVEICLTRLIQRLTPMNARHALRALRLRRNVFYFHFHGLRHQATDAALEMLFQPPADDRHGATPANAPGNEAGPEMLLSQALVIMGFDPLVASVCTAVMDGTDLPPKEIPARCCPVSFVTRTCVREVTLDGHLIRPGDRCYVSLAPTTDEPTDARFPFGTGAHTCLGRTLSLQLLAMAGRIVRDGFPDGFRSRPSVMADGAFLAFRDGPGV